MSKKYLTYEDFGAIGDGVSDDLDAIKACHDEANKINVPVKVKNGAKYYISSRPVIVSIKTDVDFGNAEFVIDDRGISEEDRKNALFSVDSDFEQFKVDISSMKKGQKTLDIPHEGNLYVRVFDENNKIFIREGLNMNNGVATNDCFILDELGNIEPGVDWDYPTVTNAYAKRIDDTPIVIKGGIFTSIANDYESFYKYHVHGFVIRRSNVTMQDMKHYVTGEGDHGAPYVAFIHPYECVNFTIKDCLLTPHLIYYTESQVPGKPVPMGSYDINSFASINVSFINVRQSIDINNVLYWGIFTSNFSKNLYLEGCELSRVDAHQGVTNITVKKCIFGHEGLLLIGFGDAYIEDTEARCYEFFQLRPDYGATWNGTLTIKNCYWNYREEAYFSKSVKNRSVILSGNKGMHNFGYTCSLPHTITIDGLRINDTRFESPACLLPNYHPVDDKERPYPYVPPKKIIIKNVVTDSGRCYDVCADERLYEGMEIIKE